MKFYDELMQILQRPPLYKRSSAPFWDDDHISAQMLKAHLDPLSDNASRNAAFIDRSVQWIKGLIPPQKRINLLDLGCGPGLYAECFSDCGYHVTGIDISGRSINYAVRSASERGLSIRYFRQNYLTVALEKQAFDIVVMIYCDYGALTPQERRIILKNVFSCLKKGGKFLLDVFSAAFWEGFTESQTWGIYPRSGFWNAQEHVSWCGRYRYPQRVTLERTVVLTKKEFCEYNIWNSCFSKEELMDEMRRAGFFRGRHMERCCGNGLFRCLADYNFTGGKKYINHKLHKGRARINPRPSVSCLTFCERINTFRRPFRRRQVPQVRVREYPSRRFPS